MSPLERFAKLATVKHADPQPALVSGDRILRDPLLAGLMGGGIGAGAVGLAGLYNMWRRNREKNRRAELPPPVMTPVPYPIEEKAATLHGSVWDIPGYVPAVIGGGMLGFYGGAKGMGSLLDKFRSKQRESELGDAEEDFERALLESQTPRKPVKLAGEKTAGEKLGEQLDALFDRLTAAMPAEKIGAEPLSDMIKRYLTVGGNAYGTYAAPVGLLTAGLTYGAVRSKSRRKLVERAMKQRMSRNYATRPSEMLTVPVPVDVQSGRTPAIDPENELESPELPLATAEQAPRGRRRLGI